MTTETNITLKELFNNTPIGRMYVIGNVAKMKSSVTELNLGSLEISRNGQVYSLDVISTNHYNEDGTIEFGLEDDSEVFTDNLTSTLTTEDMMADDTKFILNINTESEKEVVTEFLEDLKFVIYDENGEVVYAKENGIEIDLI